MDPTAALAEMRTLSARMLDDESDHVDTGDAVRLAELVQALDQWIGVGGFLPVDWTKSRPVHAPHV